MKILKAFHAITKSKVGGPLSCVHTSDSYLEASNGKILVRATFQGREALYPYHEIKKVLSEQGRFKEIELDSVQEETDYTYPESVDFVLRKEDGIDWLIGLDDLKLLVAAVSATEGNPDRKIKLRIPASHKKDMMPIVFSFPMGLDGEKCNDGEGCIALFAPKPWIPGQ